MLRNQVSYNAIKQQISALTEIAFQEFVDKLYIVCYGKKFVPIKQKRDKGCDGILNGQTIVACYAPEKYTLSDYKEKIENDFKKYKKYWMKKYPKWQVIHNKENTANMVQFINKLKNDAEIIGIKQILDDIIAPLRYSQLREIFTYLHVDEQYISYDILDEILNDLIKESEKNTENIHYKKPSFIVDKIKLNYSSEDVNAALNEYDECLRYFQILENILKENEEYLHPLKMKITRDYIKYTDGFKQRLSCLTEEYSQKYKNDEVYKNHVRAVLIYFFEQCIIGKKTEGEKK